MIDGKKIMRFEDPLAKSIPENLIQEGDIGAISGKGFIAVAIQEMPDGRLMPQKLTGSRLSHIIIALRKDGKLQWFEFTWKTGQFNPLSKYCGVEEPKVGYMVLRSVVDLRVKDIVAMRQKANELEGLPYDTPGLIGKIPHLIFRRKWLKKNPLSNSGYFCSAGVELITRAAGLWITDYKDVRLNEPKDFVLTDKLRRIL